MRIKEFALMALMVFMLSLAAFAVELEFSSGDYINDIDMVLIKGGTTVIGGKKVTVGDFYIGRYEVTQGLWKSVMGNNPSEFKGDDNLPVENVSLNDIHAFLKKLNARTAKKYRVPSELEWEYAARGGNRGKGTLYSGSRNIDDVAWHDDNSGGRTHPVGTKQSNELGLYDMTGNVWEIAIRAPAVATMLGGAWGQVGKRDRYSVYWSMCDVQPYQSANTMGFRLALDDAEPVPENGGNGESRYQKSTQN